MMGISFAFLIVSLFLDGILSNFLPFTVGNLSYFTPLFTVMSLFLIYSFFKKKDRKKYFYVIIIFGFIYDLLYTNLLFYHAILFIILGWVVVLLHKYLDTNYAMLLIEGAILVVCYQTFSTMLMVAFQIVPVTFYDFLYLVEHTMLINILYLELGFFLIRMLFKKYQFLSIN